MPGYGLAHVHAARRLELRHGGGSPNPPRDSAVKIENRNAAANRWIGGRVLQTDQVARTGRAKIRRKLEIIAQRVPQGRLGNDARQQAPPQPGRHGLPLQIRRSKRVVERAFRQPRPGRWTEEIGFGEGIAAEDADPVGNVVISAKIELIGVIAIHRHADEIVVKGRRGRVRVGTHIDSVLDKLIDHAAGYLPAVAFSVVARGCGGDAEVLSGVAGVERTEDRCGEHSLTPDRLRNRAEAHNTRGVAQTLVVAEDESLILDDRSAGRGAELIALAEWLGQACFVREEVAGVELAVAYELVHGTVQAVATGAHHRVHQRARAPSEFSLVRIRLDLELLDRFHRRLDYLRVQAAIAVRVRSIIYAIELERILEGAIAVDFEPAAETHGLKSRVGHEHARR